MYSYPLHIMFDPADTAHFFAAAGAARTAVDEHRERAAVTGALFGAFVIEDKDPSMPGAGAQDIVPGDSCIGGD